MTLTVQALSKAIHQHQIIDEIGFDWQPGEIIGLVGRNGVGKTTLFRTMTQHYLPDSGRVLIDDQDLSIMVAQQKQLFFLDTQYNFLDAYTLSEIVDFYAGVYPTFDTQQYTALLSQFDLTTTDVYRNLSKGMRALLNMVLAIASQATYIILDEPFDGLDVLVRENIAKMIIDAVADGQRGVLISSHDLRELDGLSDRVLLMRENRIVHDYNLEDVRQRAKKIQLVFKTKSVPEFLKTNSQLIKVFGRVLVVIFDHYDADIEAQIRASDPVLFEELPLTLEDLFRATVARDAGYQLLDEGERR